MFVPAISPTIAFNFLIAGEWPGNRRYEHTRAADGGERNREECLRACDSPTLRTKSCTAKESQLQSGRTHGSARRLEIELEGVGGKFPGRSRNCFSRRNR